MPLSPKFIGALISAMWAMFLLIIVRFVIPGLIMMQSDAALLLIPPIVLATAVITYLVFNLLKDMFE